MSAEKMPSPNNPMALARIIAGEHEHGGEKTLRHWRGGWSTWTGSKWVEGETAALKAELYKRLEGCVYADSKKGDLLPWLPSKTKIANLVEAIEAVTHLPEEIDPPSWITSKPGDPKGQCVACANGILSIHNRTLAPLTPRYFNTVAVPFDYNPEAPEPSRWLNFLAEIWPGDPDSITALQEWFGYVLSGRTDLQKMLMLIGPSRSGKGTIARVLKELVGDMAGPTLASLGTDFGLASLLGKPLAIISDARLGKGRDVQIVIERLLSISGEDTLDVNRKYREPWTGKLGTRMMLLSNELPQFSDDSGAIGNRFVVLTMTQSFLGRENSRLTDQLLEELPGILKWSLDGLDRLGEQGHFTMPASSADAAKVMRDMVSPISTFIREHCEVGPGYVVSVDELWEAWKQFAEDSGISKSTKPLLGRNLRTAVPSISSHQPRDAAGNKYRTYQGIRLLERSGTHWNAVTEKTAHTRIEAQTEKAGQTIGNYAFHLVPGICGTCDAPEDDHLPGCPAVAS